MERTIEGIDVVGVVGAGTMGSGIAQVAATAGYIVKLVDVDEDAIEAGIERVEAGFERAIDRGRLSETERMSARNRIVTSTDMDRLEDADLVIEAVVEDESVKRAVFADLDEIVDPGVFLASNTSTLSITSLGAATTRAEHVLGIHFMNPVPVMEGVEIVVGEHTNEDAVSTGHAFAESLGKETWQAEDVPGFVVNRILMPWINEGIRAYDRGVASKEDIDRGMKLGTNVPMGPLELADHIGLDVTLQASETLEAELGDRYRPAYLLRRKVEAGDLGRKTGAGFYEY